MPDTAATDLLTLPATDLAALVRAGEVSAREVTEASLRRIEERNPRLNAFVDVDADRALAAADAIQPGDGRPLAGVPIAIKNNRPVKDMRLTMCAPLMGDFVADHDAHLVRRLREAGCVIVGTTALPEYGPLPSTESTRFGPTRNPWDTDRTPGGSSGGSASAVSSGMVVAAHANDGGGSTRIPAACCGLVGLKPARGRISQGPDIGESFTTVDGMLTRTVAETAAFLDVLAGYEPGDATWAPPPPESFSASAAREPGRLRVAVTVSPPLEGATVDPICAGAVREAAKLLDALGHDVVEADPTWNLPGILHLFTAVFAPAVSVGIAFSALIAGREPTAEDMEDVSWALWTRSKETSAVDYAMATTQLQAVARDMLGFWEEHDLVLCPSLAERPPLIGDMSGATDDPWARFARTGRFTPFTAVCNVTGQPAISLPLFHGEDGLPIGVQLMGRPADESTLLAVSAQLEAAHPWADRRPAL